MEQQIDSGMRKEMVFLIILFVGISMIGSLILPEKVEAVPAIRGSYFVNDRLTDTAIIRDNLFFTGLTFKVNDHLFTKNRLGATFYLPWTTQSSGESVTKAFAPRGSLNLVGKDYMTNITHGTIRTVDPVAGERTTRTTSAGIMLTPDKFLPINFNYTENKALVDPVTTTNKNWSMTTQWDLDSLRLIGSINQQENSDNRRGTFSENRGISTGANATFNLWRGTDLFTSYDLSKNRNESSGNKSDTDGNSLSFLLNSDIYSWLNLSASHILDNAETANSFPGSGTSQTSTSESKLSDITVHILPVAGWFLNLHRGWSRSDDSDEIRSSTLTSFSLGVAKEMTPSIDGSLNLTRSISEDSEQGKNINDTFVVTGNLILGPAMTLRLNTSVSKRDVPENPGQAPSGPGNYSSSTNIDIWSALTPRTSFNVTYNSSSQKNSLILFGTDSQTLGGTLSYIPKPNVVYNISAFRNFPQQGDSTSSWNSSFSYRFHKGSRMIVSYQRSEGGQGIDDSLTSNFIITLPKQGSLQFDYTVSGLSQGDKTTTAGVQFSKPF